MPLNAAVNAGTCLDFDGALFNLGYFSSWGPLLVWGLGQVAPCPPPFSSPVYDIYYTKFTIQGHCKFCNLTVLEGRGVNIDTFMFCPTNFVLNQP